VYVPKNSEAYTYDADGNLTGDGRWTNVWDAENRLLLMVPLTNDPASSKRRLTFSYDYRNRRITKVAEIWDTNSLVWTTAVSNKFAYDGWNLLADINGTNNAVISSYMWGTDLSGTQQGAGGVGGLLKVTYAGSVTTNSFVAFDGYGNVEGLINAADGSVLAQYEYGPFGEVIHTMGQMAKSNPFRFSTKYQDDESELFYYGYRYLSISAGRWLSRDPIGEKDGKNLYTFVSNASTKSVDQDGRATISLDPNSGPRFCGGWQHNWIINYGWQTEPTISVQYVTSASLQKHCPPSGILTKTSTKWYEATPVMPGGQVVITRDFDSMAPMLTQGIRAASSGHFKLFKASDVQEEISKWEAGPLGPVLLNGLTPTFWNSGIEIDSGNNSSTSTGWDCCCGPYNHGTVVHDP
jgi:RHS repeat-associated protein